jgi:hypothetical protein
MVLSQSVSVPKATTETSSVKVPILSTLANLLAVDITFPQGCAGLVKARVLDRGNAIAPMGGGWFTGNGETINAQCGKALEGPPYYLTLEAFSTDDTYQHTLTVRYSLQ